MAAITGAVIAAGAAIGSGVMAANAQKKASQQQAQSVRDTNALAYQQFQESRGSNGSAILPMYMPTGTERRLADSAIQVFDSITGQPVTMTMQEYQNIIDQQQPTIDAGNRLISGIYSGDLEAQRMASLQPVLAARTAAGDVQGSALELGLQQELNRINTENNRRGFVGQSGYTQNQLLGATIAGRQAAAGARANATLQNAGDTRTVQEGMVDLQLRSLDTPINRANQLIQLSQAPAQALVQRQQLAMQPLNFFKLNPGNPPQPNTPQYSAVPSAGQMVLSGAAQGAGAIGNYYANQQLQQQQMEQLRMILANQNTGYQYQQPSTNYMLDPGTGAG
jgi:hypothetical protein